MDHPGVMPMSTRAHQSLDGHLPREALTAGEAAEAARLERVTRAVAQAVRAAPAPDLTREVMAAIAARRAASPSARLADAIRAAWAWVVQPQRFELRPAWAFAALVAISLLLAVPGSPLRRGRAATPSPAAEAPVAFVQFRLDAPGAARVRLAGSFTGWQPRVELRQTSPGVWTALVPMHPGVHDYLFVVDGRGWVPDPAASQVADGLGGVNSRVLVPALPQT